MTEYEIIENAKRDFMELQKDIKGKTFQQAYDFFDNELGTMNYNGELFDLNYGYITATIKNDKGMAKLSHSVEIWNDELCALINNNYIMEV